MSSKGLAIQNVVNILVAEEKITVEFESKKELYYFVRRVGDKLKETYKIFRELDSEAEEKFLHFEQLVYKKPFPATLTFTLSNSRLNEVRAGFKIISAEVIPLNIERITRDVAD